jgi:putative ATPase
MIEGGEDPMYVARRTIRFAAEDVGLADPRALDVALAARDAYHVLGSPEGELALAEAAVYLATAPKSNSVYRAWHDALALARESPAEPVPLHIRNAPTRLMKELGYGKGYQYAHDMPEAYVPQEYLPERLRGTTLYVPGRFGFERDIARRIAWWAELRHQIDGESHRGGGMGGGVAPGEGELGEERADAEGDASGGSGGGHSGPSAG